MKLQDDPNMFRPELIAYAASLERDAVLFFRRANVPMMPQGNEL